jgi:2-polyprenyl-3-methyl-5-hydroxy-6-metoxy-1,4-benzoquinol methylase
LDAGYRLVSLETWLADPAPSDRPTLVLRHDVDQHPRAVRPILAAERRLGVTSTWYFRWRTADPSVIAAVRAAGSAVGLHYETLTRRLLQCGPEVAVTEELVAECRERLRVEIATFKQLFGPIRSVCPHGDSRVPGVSNQVLLRGVDLSPFDIEFDGNDALGRRPLGAWLTDRSTPDGRWKEGMDPFGLIDERVAPILCLTHPNNLASGAGLWTDRLLSAALPAPSPRGARVLVRTGRDEPPPPDPGSAVPARSSFAPVADSLEREVRRHYGDRGETLAGKAGLNTLLTNSHLAERRTSTLLDVLFRHSDLDTVGGLRILDVGCGFGALAIALAARGAHVTAVDPKTERFEVGQAVARQHGLDVSFRHAWMEETDLGVSQFDLVVLNNSFCYLLDREARSVALRRLGSVLRPGGWLVMRNPNRLFPFDQFTGLPLVGLLPPSRAAAAARLLRRHRSQVRLVTNREARRELARAGYCDVVTASTHLGWLHRSLGAVSRYQHLVARRPETTEVAHD